MDNATTITKIDGPRTVRQLDPAKTLSASRMAPMVVGIGTLVGSGSTLGTNLNPMRPLRLAAREFRADAACRVPFLDHFLGPVEGLVEGMGVIRSSLAPNNNGSRTVAVRETSHPVVSDCHGPLTRPPQTPIRGRTLPAPGNRGGIGTPSQTFNPHTRPPAVTLMDRALHRTALYAT